MVFLLSSKSGGPEGFAPIPSSGELSCEGKQHRRYSHGVGFQFSLHLWVLRNEVFYGGRSANPANQPPQKSSPTAGCLQTELCIRYGWPLAHKELLRPLTGFVLHPAECPYPNTLLTRKPGGGDGLGADNPTIEQVSTGLHGTCSKSQI